MKKTTFLIVLALMIGSFGYSQILGGPTYQKEKSDRERPIADVAIDIEHIIDYIYLTVYEFNPTQDVIMSYSEFADIMKPQKPSHSILPYIKPYYKYGYSTLKPTRNETPGLLGYVRCVRIN